ncbi:MAG: ATP-binding protein [Bacteroidota bacterium]
MNRIEIKNRVQQLIQNALNGMEAESPKFDFKRKWYDLTDKFGLMEAVKDIAAIVNTIGLDGFIVIGFDDKSKKFFPTKFSDSGLSDSAQLQQKVCSKCSDHFAVNTYDFEIYGNRISVIHIPPYKYKPVVITRYIKSIKGTLKEEDQRIFVRRNTGTFKASKSEIDAMYYDRKNIQLEYEYFIDIIDFRKNSWRQYIPDRITNNATMSVVIENLGRRTLAIKKARLIVTTEKGELELETLNRNPKNSDNSSSLIKMIPPYSNEFVELTFDEEQSGRLLKDENVDKLEVIFILSNDKQIIVKKTLVENE